MPRPRSDIAPRLVGAARARFLLEGVDGASLRDIARDAKTSIGMVYYYFPTKDDLFFAVVEETYARLLEDFSAALAPDAPVRDRIRRMYERIGRASSDELEIIRLVIREALLSTTRLERLIERFQRGHFPLVVRTIFDGMTDGTFDRSIHPGLVAIAMVALGGLGQGARRAVGDRLPFAGIPSSTELSGLLVDILLRGVGNRSEQSSTSK